MLNEQSWEHAATGWGRRLASFLVVSFTVLLIMLFVAPAASAAVTCDHTGTTVTLTLGSGDSAVIGVDIAPNAGNIIFDDDATIADAAQCDDATTANTNLIDVDGTTGSETFVIDLSVGAFAATNDFNIDLGT